MGFTRTGDIVSADIYRYAPRDDWEEVTTGLGFDFALVAMKASKKVKREAWNRDKNIYILAGRWTCNAFERDEKEAILSLDDILATDWVVVD